MDLLTTHKLKEALQLPGCPICRIGDGDGRHYLSTILHEYVNDFDTRVKLAASWGLRPKLKVWVVFDDRVKFGDGRAQLLERIEALGSLKRAVAGMGMSYRAARAAGFKFLARHPGRGRTRLTAEGKRFLDRYRRFRQGLDNVVASHFSRAFRRR